MTEVINNNNNYHNLINKHTCIYEESFIVLKLSIMSCFQLIKLIQNQL